MAVETLYPENTVLESANLSGISVNTGTGVITSTVTSNNEDTILRLPFPTPSGNLSGTQTISGVIDHFGGTGTAQGRIDAYENGTLVATGATVNLTGTGHAVSVSFDASALVAISGVNVEVYFYCTRSGGGPTARATGQPISTSWAADVLVATQYDRAFTPAASGTPLFEQGLSLAISASPAATGSSTLGRTMSRLLSFGYAAAGSLARTLGIAKSFSMAASGTSAVLRAITMSKAFSATGSLLADAQRVFLMSFSATATGTLTFAQELAEGIKELFREFSQAASAAVSMTMQVAYGHLAVHSATGSAAISKMILKSLQATASGASALQRGIARSFSMSAQGTPSASAGLVSLEFFTATATAIVGATRQFIEFVESVGRQMRRGFDRLLRRPLKRDL